MTVTVLRLVDAFDAYAAVRDHLGAASPCAVRSSQMRIVTPADLARLAPRIQRTVLFDAARPDPCVQ
eukprot:1024956-Pleurochrysis_carterae.AAC.2